MSFFDTQLVKQVKDFISKYIIIVFFALGLVFVISGNIWDANLTGVGVREKFYVQTFFIKVLESLGSTILAAGVFSAIAKSSLFISIFQGIIEKIIWSKQFLKTRMDLRDIWVNVSRILYEEKFADISEEIEQVVFEKYFPTDQSYYYENFNFIVDLLLDDNNTLLLNEVITFTARPVNENIEFKYSFSSTIPKSQNDNIEYEIKKVCVNNTEIDFANCLHIDNLDPKKSVYNFSYKLSGEKKYDIILERRKKLPYRNNEVKTYLAKCIYKGFTLHLRYPENLHIAVQEMGTIDKFFKISEGNHNGIVTVITRYSGIIFPRQGVACFITKRN